MKEATSGMIFYGFYEGFKSINFPGGVAGSSSALLAMTLTYPVDVLKTRVQAGESVASARGMGSFGRGLNWAVAKCLVSNFVALSVSRSPVPTSLARIKETATNGSESGATEREELSV
jgi:hypothetical protein